MMLLEKTIWVSQQQILLSRVDYKCRIDQPLLCRFPMLSQFSVIPPLSESAQEVPSYVCPVSQLHQIVIECRMVLC
jgi:hypothetical protein